MGRPRQAPIWRDYPVWLSNPSEVIMAVTLAQVVGLSDLALRVVTVTPSLDRPLRWVAPSELADPAPWIEPGDLILTTGMAMSGDPDEARDYVDRLVAAQAVGLGFGIGLNHAIVPPALVTAAEAAGLPVVEVPEPLPFVAVSRAVSRLQAADEYAESSAAFDSQRRMIRSVLAAQAAPEDGPDAPARAVVATLARHLDGFALHLGPTGDVRQASSQAAADRAVEFSSELDRLRPRGLLASASISSAHEHVVLVPVGVRETVRGFVVAGSRSPLSSADQTVLNLAVSLLAWSGSQSPAAVEQQDRWRAALLDLGCVAGLTTDRLASVGFGGIDATAAVGICVVTDPGCRRWELVDGAATDVLLCEAEEGSLVGIASVADAGVVPAAARLLAASADVRSVGVSAVTDLGRATNVRQALEQAEVAARSATGLVSFADLEARSVESLLDRSVLRAWADAYLRPLDMVPEGSELQETLRAWLACHGQVDATAQRLGIHRHTVRHRLRRAEAALERSLDDPDVRANLWFALTASHSGVTLGLSAHGFEQ